MSSRARRAFVMASLEQYLALLLNFAMVAAVSRILTPAEIGIAVIGMGIGVIVFSLREFVTAEFLIQLPHVSGRDVRTAMTVLTAATLLLAALLVAASPLLARYYGEPGMEVFLWLIAAATLVETLSLPALALMRRDMAFGTITRIRTAGMALTVVTTILLALLGFGFMSYAWGALAGSVLDTGLSWLARRDARDLRPTFASWRAVYEFGRFRGATGFIDRAYDALPSLVLGRLLTPFAVGIYNRANAVCAIPDRTLLGAVFSFAFPALAAEVREGRPVGEHYLRAISYITACYWPALILLAVLATPVVAFVLGPDWGEVVPLVRILSIASLFFFPVILTRPVLMALGHNRDAFVAHFICRAVAAVVLCAASPFGLLVMVSGQLIAIPIEMAVSLWFVRKHVGFAWHDLGRILMGSAAVTAGAAAGLTGALALFGFRFDLSMTEAMFAAFAAAGGWLLAVVFMRHPVKDELRPIIEQARRACRRSINIPAASTTSEPG
ncbi:oligosaccharide flippase family protein [Chelativorans sp. SCAU2101]|uniref:Oligosaccharide flippase family protein n=1 Tax=Chelativorans petroleitrophicus TaxID=2975484 RepID=A0A9X2X6N7_9HYPH|nr:oligosaccharide flippase family protein [Chelativorans petroleitrophicus]MCT8990297.1 oligosaccharide flippase family protein [Chelativorans petroleitrophicus]